MSLRFLELFAGAGGMSLGLEAAGMSCVGHAEIEPHARAVLRHRWPDVPLYGDVTTLDGAALMAAHPFDVLTGGSPCQDLSVAGKRAGLAGARSGLFHHQVRIWRESGAPYLLWENVNGAFSSNGGADFAEVLSTLVGAAIAVPADGWRRGGVAAGPDAVAAWRVLDVQHVPGVGRAAPPQRRVRVFVLAARAGGVDPAEVLALGESVCGHPAPRGRAREGAARGAAGGAGGGGEGVMPTLRSGGSGNVPSSRGERKVLAHEAVAFAENQRAEVLVSDVTRQLTTGGGKPGQGYPAVLCKGDQEAVVLHPAIGFRSTGGSTRDMVLAPVIDKQSGHVDHGVTPTLKTDLAHDMGPVVAQGDVVRTLTVGSALGIPSPPAVLVHDARGNGDGRHDPTIPGDHANRVTDYTPVVLPTLAMGAHTAAPGSNGQDAAQIAHALLAAGVGRPRRLTPLEAERLMAWPDGHTAEGVDEQGRRYRLSDTARYRLAGNGIGATQAEWIGRRLVWAEGVAR